MRRLPVLLSLLVLVGCGARRVAPAEPEVVRISLIGTNDLHGHLEALPLLAGFVANLRREHEVVLVDAGDMFQGTLESNLNEGSSVVRAYELMGYDAVTIGNHEFDYGPVGPTSMPGEGDDPRGALKARIAEAHYPFLTANLLLAASGERVSLGQASVLIERSGVPIGLIGVTTEDTLTTTLPAAVADLRMQGLAEAIERESRALREQGAALVIVIAHAGGECTSFEDPDELATCDPDDEIMQVAAQLSPSSVNAIVAGHTHRGMAHRVHGIPVIESFAYGLAFGRVDFELVRGRLVSTRIHPPRGVCGPLTDARSDVATCAPGEYEGRPVARIAPIREVVDRANEAAQSQRAERAEVVLRSEFTRSYAVESALGNLFVDLLLAGHGAADVSMVNGGGLRADLPSGPVEYGAIYETFPFDNRIVLVELSASELSQVIAANLGRGGGFFSFGGIEVDASCGEHGLEVRLTRSDGSPLHDDDELRLLTSDFLITGGDHAFDMLTFDQANVHFEPANMREVVWQELRNRGAVELEPSSFYDPARRRSRYPGERPVTCP